MITQILDVWCENLALVWLSAVPRQALLLMAVALVLKFYPRMSASWRHWMWLLVALGIGLVPLAAASLPRIPLIPAEWLFGEDAALIVSHGMAEEQTLEGVAAALAPKATFSWLMIFVGVWLLGGLWLIGRMFAGMFGLRSFQRDRMPVVKGRLCARMEACRRLAGVTTVVDLYLSRRSPLPMTWGVVTPAINLPREAEDWSDERLDAVFLHELAHIRRADCWTNMALRIVCAFNWFNPFVWMAARRTYLAQEQACDDFACARLKASDYATHLLELTAVVEDFRHRDAAPAMGFSSCDYLYARLAAALDPTRSRLSLSNKVASAISFSVFGLTVIAGMVSLRVVEESQAATLVVPEQMLESAWLVDEVVATNALIDLQRAQQLLGTPVSFVESEVPPVVDERQTLSAPPVKKTTAMTQTARAVIGPSFPLRTPLPAMSPPVVRAKPVGLASSNNAATATKLVVGPAPAPSVQVLPIPAVHRPPANPVQFQDSEIDWRNTFGRRAGQRRGRTVVLNYGQSLCNRYARMSKPDREKIGSFRVFLKRNGVHLSDREIRRLIRHTQARL